MFQPVVTDHGFDLFQTKFNGILDSYAPIKRVTVKTKMLITYGLLMVSKIVLKNKRFCIKRV